MCVLRWGGGDPLRVAFVRKHSDTTIVAGALKLSQQGTIVVATSARMSRACNTVLRY